MSASEIVESRWAITIVVRSRIASVRPARISDSVVASTEAVASSRMRIRGSITSARAIASRWRCPPESVIPRSPITVSYPSGSSSMNGCACAARAAASTSSCVDVGHAEGDVVAHARREEERILGDDADLAAERAPRHVAHVDAVDQHASLAGVVEPRHERGERRLARAGGADQGDGAAGLDLEVDPRQHRPRRVVAEADPREHDAAGSRRQLPGARRVRHLLRLVDHLEEPLARGGRALRLADPHAEHAQRHHEHHQEEVEGEEAADREVALDDVVARGEQDAGLGEHRQEGEQRDVQRPLRVGLHAHREDAVARVPEPPLDLILLGERLDDVDADDRLLRHRRDVGELLLHVAQHRMRDLAVAVGDADEERRDRERDQRQLPVVEEEDGRDADDRDHVLGEEDQPVAEEEADRLQVDRRPRHQLPGLVPVEVAEREPQQARVERIAHVPLDRDRLLAGDEAAARA